jgi:hypothetical protein
MAALLLATALIAPPPLRLGASSLQPLLTLGLCRQKATALF